MRLVRPLGDVGGDGPDAKSTRVRPHGSGAEFNLAQRAMGVGLRAVSLGAVSSRDLAPARRNVTGAFSLASRSSCSIYVGWIHCVPFFLKVFLCEQQR
jgi:hypothetical protein